MNPPFDDAAAIARQAVAETAPRSPEESAAMLAAPDMRVLRLHRRDAPALPLDVFGPRWARWIADAARAAACPPDYVASLLLPAASALIGNARWAQAWTGWCEPPHLWACSVGDSGSGKSPGADALLRDVLPKLERRMEGDFPDRRRDWQRASEADGAAKEHWKSEVRDAGKRGNPPPLPPIESAGPEPQRPRLTQSDVTIERLATLLATAAPKGLLVTRDEMLGWIMGMNAYHDAGRTFWIEAYGGRPFRVERQKHPDPIDIPRLAVAVWGGTQPARLAGQLRDADDGLLSRICWFWPEPTPFAKGETAPAIGWARDTLDKLRLLDLGCGDAPDAPRQPIIVPLDRSLQDAMEDFGREMAERQQSAGGLLVSALGKARGLALRMALVLEYLRWVAEPGNSAPPSTIGADAFEGAAYLVADYFVPMAERVYGDAATRPEDRDAATLARWIIRERAAEVHVRNLQRTIRLPGLGTAAAIHAAAGALVEAGWLLPPERGEFQHRARAAYPVNARVLEVAR